MLWGSSWQVFVAPAGKYLWGWASERLWVPAGAPEYTRGWALEGFWGSGGQPCYLIFSITWACEVGLMGCYGTQPGKYLWLQLASICGAGDLRDTGAPAGAPAGKYMRGWALEGFWSSRGWAPGVLWGSSWQVFVAPAGKYLWGWASERLWGPSWSSTWQVYVRLGT